MKSKKRHGPGRGYWILCIILGVLFVLAISSVHHLDTAGHNSNDQFRDLAVTFVRGVAENHFDGQPGRHPDELQIEGDWESVITIYYQGEETGSGEGKNEILSLSLEEATANALEDEKHLSKEDLKDARFLISFSTPDERHSFIEYNGTGKELVLDLVAVRDMDKETIRQKIDEGKGYLFRAVHEDEKGARKYYYALNDSFENRLRTIYTSSLVYTLLKIYDFDKDEEIWNYVYGCADFILSMQDKDEESKRYGAFHYSYYPDSKEREKRFVVGTTSKTIFTLLELYRRTGDSKYMESAELGADWLITMQNPDGSMKPYVRYSDGKWLYSKKESLLYNGQVLSALSRIYRVTEEKKYYEAAEKIAERFAEKVEEEGCYLGDDYREENPISSSWVIMSLFDFYKVNQDERYKEIVLRCSDELLERQMKDENDILCHGRWQRAYSTSGNGWINEVMVELYEFCKEEDRECDKYKDSIINVTRWLVQHTYSEENSFFLKNPERANGGLFRNHQYKDIRTDSVCHGINAYVGIIDDLENGTLISIPERPFA